MDVNNQYRIVIHSSDKEEDALLIRVLQRSFKYVSCVASVATLSEFLLEKVPTVVLVSNSDFQKTVSTYYEALGKVPAEDCTEHFVVSLINRHDERSAYEAFKAGIIDDFLVSRPLYEVHRPVLICHHLLRELGVSLIAPRNMEYVYRNEALDHKVKKVVAEGLEKKERLQDYFELSIKNISEQLNAAEEDLRLQGVANINLAELKEILATIRSNSIRPELLKLQEKALNLLDNIVEEKVEQEASPPENSLLPEQNIKFEKKSIPKLLLVEDDPISLHCTRLTLEKYKIDIETAQSGRQALGLLNSVTFDIVFLDLNLPDSNGLYILDQIKRTEGKNQTTPIVVLTGNKNKNTVKQAIQSGAEGYIVKPLYKDVLFKHFKKFEIPLYKSK